MLTIRTVVNVMTAKYAALPNVIPSHHDVTTVTKRIYPAFQINAWTNMCQFVVSLPILSHRTFALVRSGSTRRRSRPLVAWSEIESSVPRAHVCVPLLFIILKLKTQVAFSQA